MTAHFICRLCALPVSSALAQSHYIRHMAYAAVYREVPGAETHVVVRVPPVVSP